MTRAIICSFRKYTPFGDSFYQPIFDFFISNLTKYSDEYDKLYILDSLWNFTEKDKEKAKEAKGEIVYSDPQLRYWDAYKAVLPQVKEDLVLMIDNDVVIYREGKIKETFDLMQNQKYEVVSIFDTIGTRTYPELNNKSKFCLYWFAMPKDFLMNYLDVDWAPRMPEYETLGALTEKIVQDKLKLYEWPEDKNSIYFDGTMDETKSKDTGIYHIRAGSTPAVLLAWKDSLEHKHTYEEYIKNQPRNEYLRQMIWFDLMLEQTGSSKIRDELFGILEDLKIGSEWFDYRMKFRKYHGLSII